MTDKPELYEFTEWLGEEYDIRTSTARAGQLGAYYFKCHENKEYVFEWTERGWEEVGIISFDADYIARAEHSKLCDSTDDTFGWDPVGFVEEHQEYQ